MLDLVYSSSSTVYIIFVDKPESEAWSPESKVCIQNKSPK